MENIERKAYTTTEVAKMLGINQRTVRNMVRDSRLRGIRVGNGPKARTLILAESFESLINGKEGE